jgi:hypothetical protein
MDKAKVKSTILQVAGNPTSGVIAELADELAQAIVDIDKPEVKNFNPVQETRIVEIKETR